MATKSRGFSFWGILLFLLIVGLVIGGLIYEGKNLAKTHTISSMSQKEAKQYCLNHRGKLQSASSLYSFCVLPDQSTCEIKSFAKGFCIRGVKPFDTASSQQRLCVQFGGKLLDSVTDNCTFSDGSICTSADVLSGNCHQ